MRLLIAVIVCSLVGAVAAQSPMLKTGPGGASVIGVVCDDAFRTADDATKRDLERRFRSTIVLHCAAVATKGSGRIAHSDFSFRHRFASDERLQALRMTDFLGQMGAVYGSMVREFYIGLPAQPRPWVIVLYFGDDSSQIVFTSR
jgi:hypothetical protein